MYHFLTSILFSSEYFKGERRISVESLFLSCAKVTLNWIFFFFLIFIYFLATLGLLTLLLGYSSCSKQGLLSSWGTWASHCSGFSGCGTQALECVSLAAPHHVGSSRAGDRTRVPCIGRRILNQWTTREALNWIFKTHSFQ